MNLSGRLAIGMLFPVVLLLLALGFVHGVSWPGILLAGGAVAMVLMTAETIARLLSKPAQLMRVADGLARGEQVPISRGSSGNDEATRLAAALAESGLAPERLELEITETVLIRDDEEALTILRQLRELGVRMKHAPNRAAIEGKRIILIDDSLVRGTTSKKIVRMMRDAGAKEVHFRLASPPILYPDYYGIDLPDRGGLLAATHSLEEMREIIGADSLAFLSIDGMYRAMGYEGRDPANPRFADHCFTGAYPTHLTDQSEAEPSPRQLSLLAEAS